MTSSYSVPSHAAAAKEFAAELSRNDGESFVASLTAGLDTLAVLMADRITTDPAFKIGADSMILPTVLAKGHTAACLEIQLYQVVESCQAARAAQLLPAAEEQWYLRWLAKLRLGEDSHEPAAIQRLAFYHAKTPDARRLAFETALERALPPASHAPLVLYRVYPLAIEIATQLAFGDSPAATRARRQQLDLLPNLADCQDCRGRLLENGEKCRQCGNPLWKFDWLTAE